MSDKPCQWCQKTSETIDSLEYQLEQANKRVAQLEEGQAFINYRPKPVTKGQVYLFGESTVESDTDAFTHPKPVNDR